MRPIPQRLKNLLAKRPQICARRGEGGCDGRITWEHVWVYARKQINEPWAIIFLCWRHHLGDLLDKEKNEWLSLQKASWNDLAKYPKKNWLQLLNYLSKKYAGN